MQHLVECFQRVKWWQLQPDPTLLQKQPGEKDPAHFQTAASTPNRDEVVVYLPVGGTALLNPPWGEAVWFDPRSGKIQPVSIDESGVYTAPDSQDWVLILQKEAPARR